MDLGRSGRRGELSNITKALRTKLLRYTDQVRQSCGGANVTAQTVLIQLNDDVYVSQVPQSQTSIVG